MYVCVCVCGMNGGQMMEQQNVKLILSHESCIWLQCNQNALPWHEICLFAGVWTINTHWILKLTLSFWKLK